MPVCPLCKEQALAYGWVGEGGLGLPVGAAAERQGGFLSRLFGRPPPVEKPAEPVLRQLSRSEQTLVEAAHLFNVSPHRRTAEGLTRSLGWPQISIVSLSGTNPEVVLTICWEISWYQYRVTPESQQPVQLAERGYDPADLTEAFTEWNAAFDESSLLVPDLPEE